MSTYDAIIQLRRNLVFHDIIIMNRDKELILQKQFEHFTNATIIIFIIQFKFT